ncbi:MAG: ArnT family glycosyltransferase, partial [Planctomycetota bacterium]
MCPRPPDDPPGRRGARLLLAVVLAATVLTAFIPRDLWTPDEQRYGQVPREILRDGDPIVLHLNGEPYAEKPPLFFWAVALLSWPHGDVTSFTARLAGCLFAAGAFLVLWILVRRWFGSEGAATTAVLIFATNLLLLHNAT